MTRLVESVVTKRVVNDHATARSAGVWSHHEFGHALLPVESCHTASALCYFICDPINLVTAVECGHKSLDTRTTHALVTHPLKERVVTQDVNHHNLGH
eukprot:scaffold6156_cov142-Skeletonema_menzelii.AAC.4